MRLLACDLDGTLLEPEAGTRDFCRRWETVRDVHLVYVTGRTWPGTRGLLGRVIPVPDAVVTATGTEVRWRDGSLDTRFHERLAAGWDPAAVLAALSGFVRLPAGDAPLRFTVAADRAQVEAALRRQGARAAVIPADPGVVDVCPRGAGKDRALAYVARRLGVGEGDVWAVGNAPNDGPMLGSGVVGAVVANADPAFARSLPARVIRCHRPGALGVLELLERMLGGRAGGRS